MEGLIKLEFLIANLSPKTQNLYRYGFRKFIEFLKLSSEESLFLFLKDRIADRYFLNFVNSLNGLAPKTIRLYVGGIKLWMEANGIRANWAVIKRCLPRARIVKNLKSFTRAEVKKIIQNSPPEYRLLFWFYAVTGLRLNEALDLKVSDLNVEHEPMFVTVHGTKTEAAKRIVFIPKDVAEELKDFIRGKRKDDYIFEARMKGGRLNQKVVDKVFRRTLKKIGLLERDSSGRGYTLSLHALRRFYETTLINAGVNKMIVDMLMGHNNGIDAHYFKPTTEEVIKEWKKAENALVLFTPPSLEEQKKEIEAIKTELAIYKEALQILLEREGLTPEKVKESVKYVLKHILTS